MENGLITASKTLLSNYSFCWRFPAQCVVPVLDLNIYFSAPLEECPVFKDLVDKRLELPFNVVSFFGLLAQFFSNWCLSPLSVIPFFSLSCHTRSALSDFPFEGQHLFGLPWNFKENTGIRVPLSPRRTSISRTYIPVEGKVNFVLLSLQVLNLSEKHTFGRRFGSPNKLGLVPRLLTSDGPTPAPFSQSENLRCLVQSVNFRG